MEHAAYGQLPQRVGGMQGHDRPVIPGHHHPPSALPSMTPSDENKAMMQGMNDPRAMAIARDDVQHPSGMLVPVPLRVPGPANAGGAAAGGATPNVSEEEMLRRTLVELLVENEALRGALHEGGPGGPGPAPRERQGQHPGMCFPPYANQHQLMSQQLAQHPMMSQHPNQDRSLKQNARNVAVERYRQKRKRRLEAPNLNGPRYEKMKAVADGKRRNSSGKFVKKEVRLAEEAAAAAAAAAAANNAAAHAIEPAEEQAEQPQQPESSANDAVAEVAL